MSETSRPPVRLSEQAQSPLELALLRAGMNVRVASATRAAVLETLGLDGRIGVLAKPRIMSFRRASFLLAAMVVSAAAVAVPLVRRSLSVPAETNLESQALPTPIKAESQPDSRVGRESEIDSGASRPSEEQISEAQASKPTRATDEPGASRAGHLSGRNALAAELAALDAVRVKLAAGEPKAAQQLLDVYQRDFPKPRLALEAEVLRIDALDRAGQSEAARKRAAAFVQAHPKGVLTGRVRRYLEK